MRYEGSIYRPPSEARSLIIQATIGCSHNRCSFCSMYKDKNFRIRDTNEILDDILVARNHFPHIKRIFLADGDALMIKTPELIKILDYIKAHIPECERIGIYASPKSILTKSLKDLKTLKSAGLDIAYLGLESGSDKVLLNVNKGATSNEIVKAGIRLKESEILVSITLISGLGGKDNWKEHAISSAKAISQIKPDYLGLLTLMVEPETKLYEDVAKEKFKLLSPKEIAIETLEFLTHIDSEGTIFRSNHASNYISLKGTLNRDKDRMIRDLKEVINNDMGFKEEWMRRL